MYALETCRHCRKTREFLEENKVQYHLVYVDRFSGEARSNLMDKVRAFNPRGSFPTIVMPGGKTVVGFREQLLREALLHDSGSAA
ncbi:MAG: glutaredoxin family protein [Desulfovibrionaceae bacterium]|nr:glutaredoxin family protein [Desulfovibrionaceae bacterium]PWM65953.1 MAG: glutaredoxin family protein [Desulfovibrionaceae bacterium]